MNGDEDIDFQLIRDRIRSEARREEGILKLVESLM